MNRAAASRDDHPDSTVPAGYALDPWAPPPADVEWFKDPAKRANYAAALEHHNELLFLDAVSWSHMWRGEIAADARAGETSE